MITVTLRTKFLLALVAISASITTAVLLVVRERVEIRARDELVAALDTSIVSFDRVQRQREFTLERSAALLAALPPLKALMTSDHPDTIQDASATFWQLAGSQVFLLTDREGTSRRFTRARRSFRATPRKRRLRRYLAGGNAQDWWFGGGHLFQVFLQPVSLGDAETGYPSGCSPSATRSIRRSRPTFAASRRARSPLPTTVSSWSTPSARTFTRTCRRWLPAARARWAWRATRSLARNGYSARTVSLTRGTTAPVTLTVLKSLAGASAFLENLNRWILAIGIAGIASGSLLVFVVSTTFTRPLGRLVAGVKALERGDFAYPLDGRGGDEVSTLTRAFEEMRHQQQITQRRLIDAERLATIGRVASTISHDLRHPLTAIQAYAEFLAERDLSEASGRTISRRSGSPSNT